MSTAPHRPRAAWTHASPRAIVGAGLLIALLCAAAQSRAQEQIRQQEPSPSSVQQETTPIERSFIPSAVPKPVELLPALKERLKEAPPFFRDTTVDVNLRTYYLNRKQYDESSLEAWAAGAALSYQSGWLLDTLSIGAVLYTSQPLYAPADRDGTGLLEPGQNGFTTLGQLYVRLKILDRNVVNLYRYTYDTPYLNRDDSRMAPKTFEGYTLQGSVGGEDGELGLRYGGGYITKIKDKDSDEFVWMSRQAGASIDRGVELAGALLSYGPLSIGGIDYYCADVINIAYGEGKYLLSITSDAGALFSTQYVDQRSVGGNRLTGSAFDTNLFATRVEASRAGAVLSLAYSQTARGADLQNPWSGNPAYTGAMIQKFARAGEQALLTKLSYDFSRIGATGLAAYALFAHGWSRVSPGTKTSVPNENEVNVDVQWRPAWARLAGLWLRARYGHVGQYEGSRNTMNEFRLIVNYDFSLL